MNIKRIIKISLLAAAFSVCLATVSRAEESFDRLVARWKLERDQIVKHMTQAWLRGERPETMRADLMQLSQVESGLATRPGTFLYVGTIENPNDMGGSVTAVARAYLKQRGALVDSAEFLRGKTFLVIKERIVPKKVVKTQNYTYGGSQKIETASASAETVTEIERTEVRY